jgi:hypothetical protein
MGCAADEKWDEGRVSRALKLKPLARGVNPNRKSIMSSTINRVGRDASNLTP